MYLEELGFHVITLAVSKSVMHAAKHKVVILSWICTVYAYKYK